MKRKSLLIGTLVAVPLLAGGTAAAFAAGTPGQPSAAQTFIADVASHLGISTSKLTSAIQQARIDQIQSAVSAGKLSQTQANQLEQRVKSGDLGKGFGPGFGGPGRRGGPRFADMQTMMQAASTYLGIPAATLRQDMQNGQSLSQIATSSGKTAQGLEDAIVAAVKSSLQQAVSSGKLTQTQATNMEGHLQAMVQQLVERQGFQKHGFAPPQGGSDSQTTQG